MEDKISLIRLSLTDDTSNPNFEANRKYALKILDELHDLVRNCSIPDVVGQSEQLKCAHQPKRFDKKHTSCKKCGKILQMKP